MNKHSCTLKKLITIRGRGLLAVTMMASMVLAGIGFGIALDGPSIAHSAPAALQAATPTAQPSPQRLTITPTKATVGADILATAAGLPPNAVVDLVWQTVDGGWVIEDYYHFQGKQYTDSTFSLGQAKADATGHLATHFTVPEDYGGVHDLLVTANGVTLAQGGIEVAPSFTISPTSGPVGTLVEVQGKGLGWRTMESTWVLNWDNHEVGWISATDTRGSAIARFRAAGPEGDHAIKVYTGYMGQSYLNFEQAPTAYLPRPEFVFHTIAGGEAPASLAETYQPQPVPPSASTIGARLAVTPTQGPVMTTVRLQGNDFPAGKSLSLVWETWAGSRVTEAGYASTDTTLGEAVVDANGELDLPLTIPDDLGGLHALVLKEGDEELARTYFVIETSIIDISPTSGPAGTPVTIHLKGVGWTEYDNIYVATYDNAYMGYACGFNSQGDVVIHFTATGEPGVHLIDLYPGIYQGPKEGQQLYRLPQLTYADDHPGNKIPALRFAFEVTE